MLRFTFGKVTHYEEARRLVRLARKGEEAVVTCPQVLAAIVAIIKDEPERAEGVRHDQEGDVHYNWDEMCAAVEHDISVFHY